MAGEADARQRSVLAPFLLCASRVHLLPALPASAPLQPVSQRALLPDGVDVRVRVLAGWPLPVRARPVSRIGCVLCCARKATVVEGAGCPGSGGSGRQRLQRPLLAIGCSEDCVLEQDSCSIHDMAGRYSQPGNERGKRGQSTTIKTSNRRSEKGLNKKKKNL